MENVCDNNTLCDKVEYEYEWIYTVVHKKHSILFFTISSLFLDVFYTTVIK